MHRCLFISEILCTILEFTQQYDESPSGDGREDRKLTKQTLASLAQTCRALNSPALDQLWMRLDSLDPLIKLLPGRIWEKHSLFIVVLVRLSRFLTPISTPLPQVRMFMNKNQLSPFRKYAARVRCLRGPCRGIPPSVQRNVVTALARSPKLSLPLLPNLTELVWNELNSLTDIDMTVSLVKFIVGPRATSLSLLLPHWPRKATVRALSDLPNLCPNVTSFTPTVQGFGIYDDDDGRYIADIVRRWPHLQILQTNPIFPSIMMELISKPALQTLSLQTGYVHPENIVYKLPDSIHTFSLDTLDPQSCLHCLNTLQGSPTRFNLRIRLGVDHACPSVMDDLFQTLPTRFDNTQLRALTIDLAPFPSCPPAQAPSVLTKALLTSLYAFSALRTLDLSSFCSVVLVDATYGRMAATWPELRCLKVGTTDMFKGKPMASVGAVIAVLSFCPHLQTLHIVFDGSIPPPSFPVVTDMDKVRGGQHGESVWGSKKVVAVRQVNRWGGISNRYITQLHVGHSPIGEDMERLKELASCLRSVMPRLGTIRSEKEPPDAANRWRMVQHLLEGGDALALGDG
jgi:hypothetical protein